MGGDIRIKRINLGLSRLRETIEEFSDDARLLLDFSEVDYTKIHHPNISDDYEKELIQVAASAVAAILDRRMQYDDSQSAIITDKIIQEILKERDRQDAKFFPMPRKLSSLVWLAVLFEELGEVAQEIEV